MDILKAPTGIMEKPGEANRQIYFTNDYGMFGWIKGNRLLDESRIKKICKANRVDGINLFPYVPILVTKDNKVIDGQHRLMAAKSLLRVSACNRGQP